MAPIPKIITRNHGPEREPIRDICASRPLDLEAVPDDIRATGKRKTEPSMRHDKFIEVQVWDARPIRSLSNRQESIKWPT